MSIGGQMGMHVLNATEDPQTKTLVQAAIVFWVIFMLKTIYHYAWKQQGVAPTGAGTPTTTAARAVDDEPAAPRRRRVQRA